MKIPELCSGHVFPRDLVTTITLTARTIKVFLLLFFLLLLLGRLKCQHVLITRPCAMRHRAAVWDEQWPGGYRTHSRIATSIWCGSRAEPAGLWLRRRPHLSRRKQQGGHFEIKLEAQIQKRMNTKRWGFDWFFVRLFRWKETHARTYIQWWACVGGGRVVLAVPSLCHWH